MARRPARRPPQRPRPDNGAPHPPLSDRDKIIEAFFELLAEQAFEDIGYRDLAARAGVPLATLRREFGSKLPIVAAYVKAIDRKVLAGDDADMADEPPRERLFDVLMRRLDGFGAPPSEPRACLQRFSGDITALDADSGKYRRRRAQGDRARPRLGSPVLRCAAYLRGRRE